ncbi:hypothetical protein F2Q68_00033681 [Brassica cretica]|uniref:Secreted protein n=1 Tax=Brassica cretica TaxID=69181 RepID=A0A8S9H6H5_BRACR|nr:hypothetical protein F2Q68_00033681 [Brassica cretica]
MLRAMWTWWYLLACKGGMQQGMWTPVCRHACDRKHAGRHTGDQVAHSYWQANSIYTQLPWFIFTSFRHTKDTPKPGLERDREKEVRCFRSIDICQFVDPRSRCQFVDPRLETMSGLKPRGGSSSSLHVIASSNGTTKPAGRGPESGGLGLTWFYHQGRVSHMDVAAPGESDRGPGHGDSD